MKEWIFKSNEINQAFNYYELNGFVGFSNLVTKEENNILVKAFDNAVKKDIISQGIEDMIAIDDAVYISDEFINFAKNKKIIKVVNFFLNSKNIQLQHSKINSKPLKDNGSGEIKWHQDYPYFPHTNFDLLAVGIHLDDEDKDSGSLKVLPKSHKLGLLTHCDKKGNFLNYCDISNVDISKSKLLVCPAGTITIHNCLTLHQSSKKNNNLKRRLLVNQYKTSDNLQIGGPLWKCTGMKISDNGYNGSVRFMGGSIVENRGKNGRLYDLFGSLKSNK